MKRPQKEQEIHGSPEVDPIKVKNVTAKTYGKTKSAVRCVLGNSEVGL